MNFVIDTHIFLWLLFAAPEDMDCHLFKEQKTMTKSIFTPPKTEVQLYES